jgi:hypothetical protein
MSAKPVPPMPDWLRLVADDSSVGAKDFAAILGVCVHTLNDRIADGLVPPPDYRLGAEEFAKWKPRRNNWKWHDDRDHKVPTRKWRVATVKQFLAGASEGAA